MGLVTIGEATGLRPYRKYCDPKQRFETRGKAEAALRALKRADAEGRKEVDNVETMRVYECSDVNGDHFHIGHWRRPDVEPYNRGQRGKKENGR